MPTQKRNDEQVGILGTDFQPRYEPNFAWKSAISAILALPGLRACWPMSAIDYTNPQCLDIAGGQYHLTNNNTCTFGDFRSGTQDLVPYVELPGTNQTLSRADGGAGQWADIIGTETYIISAQRGLTVGCWAQIDVFSGDDGIIGKYLAAGNQRSYLLYSNGVNTRATFAVSTNGIANVGVSTGTLSTATWYHFVGRFIPSTRVSIFCNGVEYANAVGVPATIFDSTARFEIGAFSTGTAILDGRVSLAWLCASALTDTAIVALYNQQRAMFNV